MTTESMGELVSVAAPAETTAESGDMLPATIEDGDVVPVPEEGLAQEGQEGDVLEGDYIREVVDLPADVESVGEQEQSAMPTGDVLYATETYQEYGPVERKRKRYESLL